MPGVSGKRAAPSADHSDLMKEAIEIITLLGVRKQDEVPRRLRELIRSPELDAFRVFSKPSREPLHLACQYGLISVAREILIPEFIFTENSHSALLIAAQMNNHLVSNNTSLRLFSCE